MAAKFSDAGGDVNIEIGAAIEQASNPGEVLSIAANMSANEGGLRITGNYGSEPFNDVQERGEWRACKSPVGVIF